MATTLTIDYTLNRNTHLSRLRNSINTWQSYGIFANSAYLTPGDNEPDPEPDPEVPPTIIVRATNTPFIATPTRAKQIYFPGVRV